MANTQMDFGNPNFINNDLAEKIETEFGSPCYVYSEQELENRADEFIKFPNAYGLTVRYAMKANSQINILKIFNSKGIKIDASSEYEAYRAINAGYKSENISISTQELPTNLEDLIKKGVFINATSVYQIKELGKIAKKLGLNNLEIGIRINPGAGSGAFKKIATGGTTSGFGIWFEQLNEVKNIALENNLKIVTLHVHIGSENTPESWVSAVNTMFGFVEKFEDVVSLDMGGGYKMAIMPYEERADLKAIGEAVAKRFENFHEKTGRKINLEVEPGKFLVINSCSVIAKIVDIVNTGEEGHEFIRINSGMTDMPRVPMYGVQEPIYIMNKNTKKQNYVMIGHCCESGDLLTSKLYDAETIEERNFNKANIGDLVIIDGVGGYNSSMAMKNYNSFPESAELLLRKDGSIVEIRKREGIKEIWRNEISVV